MSARSLLALPLLALALAAVAPAQPEKGASKSSAKALAAVPADAAGVFSLDVAKVWDHRAFAPVRDARGSAEFVWAIHGLFGVGPADMARFTLFWPAKAAPDAPFAVVTGRKPLDPALVARHLARMGEPKPAAGGKVQQAPGAEFAFVARVDDRTVLLGPKTATAEEVAKLAEGTAGGKGPLAAAVAEAGKHTLTVAVDVKALAGAALPFGGPLLEAETAVLNADLRDDGKMSVELTGTFPSAAKAKAASPVLKAKLDELAGWSKAQAKRAYEKADDNTAPGPLFEWAAAALKGAKVAANGPALTAAAEVDFGEGVTALMYAVPDALLAQRGDSPAANNIKQIVLGIINYADTNNKMPNNVYSKDGKPLLSWRVQILPFIEQANLFQQFKLDEAWDSPANKPFSDAAIKVFMHPGRPAPAPNMTFFQGFVGPKDVKPDMRPWLVEGDDKGLMFPAGFPDGTSNTFLVAEAAEAVPWAKPADLPFDGVKLPALGGPGGRFVVGFADGSTRTFRRAQFDDNNLRALITVAGGEVVVIPNR